MEKVLDIKSYKNIKKFHQTTNHRSDENMLYAYRNVNKLDEDIIKAIKRVHEECMVCSMFKETLGRPRVTMPWVMDFNEVVSLDLK